MGQFLQPQQPPFKLVILGHGRVVGDAHLHHGVDDGGAHLVVQMAALLGPRVGAQAVQHILFVQQGIVDKSADVGVFPQASGDGSGGVPPGGALGGIEQGENFALRHLFVFAVDIQTEFAAPVNFGKKTSESTAADIGGFHQDFLFRLGEVVSGQEALMVQVVPIGF